MGKGGKQGGGGEPAETGANHDNVPGLIVRPQVATKPNSELETTGLL
jgi:hypothetical protein